MRKILLFLIVITTSIVFTMRLFYLQVYASEPYSIYEDNAIRKVFTYPKRGYIYDRNNNLLVSNQPSYDVMIIPGLVKELDTLEFCDLLKISKTYLPKDTEKYMCEKHKVFFRMRLNEWKKELIKANNEAWVGDNSPWGRGL